MFVYILQENHLFINILNKFILCSNNYITVSKLEAFIYILHPRQWVWGRGGMGHWSWEGNRKHWVHGNRNLRRYTGGYVKDSDLAEGQ